VRREGGVQGNKEGRCERAGVFPADKKQTYRK
jgi:hypothetical protein